jgi:hypothetical protein
MNATRGAGTTYHSRIPESPSRRMPQVEQELLSLPEYLSHHQAFVVIVTHVLYRVSSSCSTSGIRRDGDSGIVEGCVVPTPLVAFVLKVTRGNT